MFGAVGDGTAAAQRQRAGGNDCVAGIGVRARERQDTRARLGERVTGTVITNRTAHSEGAGIAGHLTVTAQGDCARTKIQGSRAGKNEITVPKIGWRIGRKSNPAPRRVANRPTIDGHGRICIAIDAKILVHVERARAEDEIRVIVWGCDGHCAPALLDQNSQPAQCAPRRTGQDIVAATVQYQRLASAAPHSQSAGNGQGAPGLICEHGPRVLRLNCKSRTNVEIHGGCRHVNGHPVDPIQPPIRIVSAGGDGHGHAGTGALDLDLSNIYGVDVCDVGAIGGAQRAVPDRTVA